MAILFNHENNAYEKTLAIIVKTQNNIINIIILHPFK